LAGLGKSQKPIIMPSYPHMMSEDTAVWSKYLESPVAPISEVWYDVHVGRAVPLPAGSSDMERRIAAGITRKRIDVVARVKAGLWVIELKPFAGMQALGQILSYHRLFVKEYRPACEVLPVIISSQADEDLLDQFEVRGLVVITV